MSQKSFFIRNRETDKRFSVDAESYQEAAAKAACRIDPKAKGAVRQSGDADKSGIFQGIKRDGSTTGAQFTVT